MCWLINCLTQTNLPFSKVFKIISCECQNKFMNIHVLENADNKHIIMTGNFGEHS